MKKISFSEWLVFIFWINHLPAFLMAVAVLMVCVSITNLFMNPVYWFATGLFILVPFCTDNLRIFRMLLTASPGIVLIIVALFFSESIQRMCLGIAGVLGFVYFARDFYRQYTKYKYMRRQSIDWFFDPRLIKRYMNSKCSRQVFIRTAYRKDSLKGRKVANKIRYIYKQKWYHFFPTSEKPLIGIWFPRQYDWVIKKLKMFFPQLS